MRSRTWAGWGLCIGLLGPAGAQQPDPNPVSRQSGAVPSFGAFDADGDGSLSSEELGGGELDAGLSRLDADGNGQLSPEELRSASSGVSSVDSVLFAPPGEVSSGNVAGGDLGVAELGERVPRAGSAGGGAAAAGFGADSRSAVPGGSLSVGPALPNAAAERRAAEQAAEAERQAAEQEAERAAAAELARQTADRTAERVLEAERAAARQIANEAAEQTVERMTQRQSQATEPKAAARGEAAGGG